MKWQLHVMPPVVAGPDASNAEVLRLAAEVLQRQLSMLDGSRATKAIRAYSEYLLLDRGAKLWAAC
eukprot:3775826-Alexandrium_andersonii.AAC.1